MSVFKSRTGYQNLLLHCNQSEKGMEWDGPGRGQGKEKQRGEGLCGKEGDET